MKMRKTWVPLLLASLLLALPGPALAMPWPFFRDAGGDNWKDHPIGALKPTDPIYKEYDFAATWPRWADQDIRDAISWDLMRGYPDGQDWIGRPWFRFRAERPVTRAEFVTILNRALAHPEDAAAARAAFPGERLADWYAGHLGSLVSRGVVDAAGPFDGSRPATRREIAGWLGRVVRAEGLALEQAEPSFPDFRPEDPGYDDAIHAVRAGLMRGYEDGTFRPDATFTRAQSAAVIVRLVKSLPPGKQTMTADQFRLWWNVFTLATASNHDPAVYLAWVTPEVGRQAIVEDQQAAGKFGNNDRGTDQGRWGFDLGPTDNVGGIQAVRVLVAGRTAMMYDIVTTKTRRVSDTCVRLGIPWPYRVWVRLPPEGVRITDVQVLQDEEFRNWYSRPPAWYQGPGYYEILPDGTPRDVGYGKTCE